MWDLVHLLLQIRLLFGRYSHSAVNLREKRRSGNCYRPLHPSQAGREYIKAPAKFLAGAFDLVATTFPLRSCRCRSSCFLVLDNPGWLAQHDFAHEHSVTDRRVIDRCRHVRSNRRPTYGASFRIHNGRVSRVVITRWRNIRRRSEHKIIRIRRICHDRAGTVCRCCLSCRCAGYRVRCRSCCRSLLRARYSQCCYASHGNR